MSLDVKRLTAGIHDYLGKAFSPVNARIAALESRIALLEAREAKGLADAYKGAWMVGHYKRGALVTRNGHLWLCLTDSDSRPGDGPQWKMIVRGGSGA